MEQHAELVERLWDVKIDIVGFDMGSGLATRTDGRDCSYAFHGGEFAMDEDALRSRLRRSVLRLGDVSNTVRSFGAEDHAPIGFVCNDLDLYTSTRDSFSLFGGESRRLLPRVPMYFDDLRPGRSVRFMACDTILACITGLRRGLIGSSC